MVVLVKQLFPESNAIGNIVTPLVSIHEIQEDPEDNRILECAIKAGVNYIISGDNHLLNLKKYKNIRIVSPDEYLTRISDQDS